MLNLLLAVPLSPLRGLTALARVLQTQAERELHDPVQIQRQLEELEHAAAVGELSPAELADAQQRILDRLIG
ncbi:gas vesicle protein GvpG [Plantactinospora sonchi]|uniref:Gas vesicle protein GvpG n=1 Tax=Plantactinospora sonchi TaxID=1544735 RepID=A0ABU7RRK6_9ACTN